MSRTSAPENTFESLVIVLRGHFNPAIVSPAWLVNKGLIGEAESEEIEEQTILPRASVFALSWLRVEVTDDRFAVHCQDPLEYQRLRDVAVGFIDALPETPVLLLGINRVAHLRLPSEEAWHSIGDRLMPKEPWADALHLPGMRTATIEGARTDGCLGFIRVRVEPSNSVPNGLFVEINDHFVLENERTAVKSRSDLNDAENVKALQEARPTPERLSMARDILANRWDDRLAAATRLIDHVSHLAAGA